MKIKIEPFIRYTVLIVFLLVFLVYFYWKSIEEANILNENHRYTIGQINKIEFGAEGGQDADYIFHVNSIEYKSSEPLDGTKKVQAQVGQRYLIKYCVNNPKISKLMVSNLILDSLEIVPKDGWDSIPSYVLQSK